MKYLFWSAVFIFIIGFVVDYHTLGWLFIYEAGVLFIITAVIGIFHEV